MNKHLPVPKGKFGLAYYASRRACPELVEG